MKIKTVFLWILPVLTIAFYLTANFAEQAYQKERQRGWVTYDLGDCCIHHLAIDRNGRIWAGGFSTDLKVFDGSVWNAYAQDGDVEDIVFDSQNHVWVALGNQVQVFDGQKWIIYSPENSGLVNSREVTAIAIDDQDRAWIGTEDGVSIFDGKSWITYTEDNSDLANSLVLDIAIDQKNRAWIANWSGISVFDGQGWLTYNADDFDFDTTKRHFPGVSAIAFDSQDRAWINLGWGELRIFDGESWISALGGGAITFDHRGWAWIGKAFGLDVIDPDTLTVVSTYDTSNSGISHKVSVVAFDSEGRGWIAGDGFVSVFSPSEIALIPQATVRLEKYVFSPYSKWYIIALIIGLWLAIFLGVFPEALVASIIGLLISTLFPIFWIYPEQLDNHEYIGAFHPGVYATFGGIVTALVVGLFGNLSHKQKPGGSIGLAIVGALIAAGFGFYVLFFIYGFGT